MGSSKISGYQFDALSTDLESFREEVTNLINYGKYATTMTNGLPTWRADPGQEVIYGPASGGHTAYRYFNSAWVSTWSVTV